MRTPLLSDSIVFGETEPDGGLFFFQAKILGEAVDNILIWVMGKFGRDALVRLKSRLKYGAGISDLGAHRSSTTNPLLLLIFIRLCSYIYDLMV